MAEIPAQREEIKTRGDDCHVITWDPITSADQGEAIEMPGSVHRSVQVSGTFGPAGKAIIEGSNNGSIWAPLSDGYGNRLEFMAAGISNVGELTRWIRPRGAAGASLSVRVDLLMRRSHK